MTGINNRNNVKNERMFIDLEMFKKIVQYCEKNNFMKPTSYIDLYIWGEPFLHPQLKEIIHYLNKEKLYFQISSNASIPIIFSEEELAYCVAIHFSMPGFSQESYDRVHMFNFEKIKYNIELMADNYYNKAGLQRGRLFNIFHMYQYNLIEIPDAINFSYKVGATFRPYVASFLSQEGEEYVMHTLSRERLEKASRELLLTTLEKTLYGVEIPGNYCKLYDEITINEKGQVMQCCAYPDFILGNLFDMKAEEINKIKDKSERCVRCRKLGLDYGGNLSLHEILPIITTKDNFTEKAKEKILSLLEVLFHAHIILGKVIMNQEMLYQLTMECQKCAIQIGEYIESIKGEEHVLVKKLEEYCENVYKLNQRVYNKEDIPKIQQSLDMEIMYIKCKIMD